jgi:hypothetical protein
MPERSWVTLLPCFFLVRADMGQCFPCVTLHALAVARLTTLSSAYDGMAGLMVASSCLNGACSLYMHMTHLSTDVGG